METIQVVLEKKLLQAADRAARRMKQDFSALVRDALRGHLRLLATQEREDLDRAGYARTPQALDPWGGGGGVPDD
jgi:metal-responsive CopG/Arc/MetJ family transcriptional regulator